MRQDSLKEVLDNMDQTRTVWHMQLDHQRNRVLRINLLIRCGVLWRWRWWGVGCGRGD